MDLRKRRPLAGPQPFRAPERGAVPPRLGAGPDFARAIAPLSPPRPVAPARCTIAIACERTTP
ncbi:hypothetical protein SAMN04244550_02936 [Rhodobacter capsulatus]|uniref:Uncharacterized protein n=1 Tax=Rhodobacter capsulatus TaxID=1061 RepID=A0A1G7PC78_RHOCA|nr:hypothetical protein SAMN04244550_02936 [Rhodobacter capsulatus]